MNASEFFSIGLIRDGDPIAVEVIGFVSRICARIERGDRMQCFGCLRSFRPGATPAAFITLEPARINSPLASSIAGLCAGCADMTDEAVFAAARSRLAKMFGGRK